MFICVISLLKGVDIDNLNVYSFLKKRKLLIGVAFALFVITPVIYAAILFASTL